MPKVKKTIDPVRRAELKASIADDAPEPVVSLPPVEEKPKRSLRLLSWDKKIHAGMLHIQSDIGSAVYYVRRIDTMTPTFQFQKLQPEEDGLKLPFPYTTHLYTEKDSYKGVCHCQGYKARKTCRHVDAAVALVQEYKV